MNTTSRATLPWDTLEYQQIVAASYRAGEVFVGFADGTEARLPARCLVSPNGPEPDWPNLRADEFHLVVPSAAGEIEIPWHVIRVHSDPAFDAFWEEVDAESVSSGATPRVERAG